ncbi:MAG: hypothetical protein FJZ09_01360 [Candidatus Omnitrophica bacterium]|nr:hypothetical protein [Candidatus Omnitrophota bacterium]
MGARTAFATAQIGDTLIYKGGQFSISSEPLESYFDENHPRPRDLFEFSCTACWRGYVATWKVEDGFLYLVKVIEGTCDAGAPEIPIKSIFPDREAPVKAVWYSGVIRIPQGELLEYVHMGYDSVYEKELLLTFEKGKLTGERLNDNRADKDKDD